MNLKYQWNESIGNYCLVKGKEFLFPLQTLKKGWQPNVFLFGRHSFFCPRMSGTVVLIFGFSVADHADLCK